MAEPDEIARDLLLAVLEKNNLAMDRNVEGVDRNRFVAEQVGEMYRVLFTAVADSLDEKGSRPAR